MIPNVISCLLLLLNFICLQLPCLAAENSPAAKTSPIPEKLPVSGQELAGMEEFEQAFEKFMKHWHIPGASVAIMNKGKLTYSRGFGYANFAERKIVQPDSLFRMASLAKLITVVATLKLVDEGKLKLDGKVASILNYPRDSRYLRQPDPRLGKITVQHCLENSAGWDRAHNGDPMFMPLAQQAAEEYSNSLRPSPEAIIRYQFARPLDFSPGTKYSYSNFEYSILGELIRKVSGMSYAQYVREKILAPMGITKMLPGKTRELAANEVTYYGYPRENKGQSIFPNIREMLPLEYGGDFYLEAMTADCGWVCSTVDMARFVACTFGDCGAQTQPLSVKSTALMTARPSLQEWEGLPDYFGMGWEVLHSDKPAEMIYKKDGSLPGSATMAIRRPDGTTVVVAFNSRPLLALEFQARLLNLLNFELEKNKGWRATSGQTTD